MMNTGLNQGSAKDLPIPDRRPGGSRRDVAMARPRTEFAAPPVNLADCSDSWYHAAAIEDEKNGRDH